MGESIYRGKLRVGFTKIQDLEVPGDVKEIKLSDILGEKHS